MELPNTLPDPDGYEKYEYAYHIVDQLNKAKKRFCKIEKDFAEIDTAESRMLITSAALAVEAFENLVTKWLVENGITYGKKDSSGAIQSLTGPAADKQAFWYFRNNRQKPVKKEDYEQAAQLTQMIVRNKAQLKELKETARISRSPEDLKKVVECAKCLQALLQLTARVFDILEIETVDLGENSLFHLK